MERTQLDDFGGCAWTISFMEDEARFHPGDMPMLQVQSFLVGSLGHMPSIIVAEERNGTKKEAQTIFIDAGSGSVDPASSFKLRYGDEVTGDILVLPKQNKSLLRAQSGGDDSVSHLTSFALSYEGHTTSKISSNFGSCDET